MNIMKKPIISICIPTFNRPVFLKECLASIEVQFAQEDLIEKVEVVVLDNNSTDNTREIIESFCKKNVNFYYYKNDTNIGMKKNLLEVAKHAKGEYVWFFSDDDLQTNDALSTVIKNIEKSEPGIMFCNYKGFTGSPDNLSFENGLRVEEDLFFLDRESFFHFLNKVSHYPLYGYLTYYSDLIIKNEFVKNSWHLVDEYFDKLDLFPHEYIFYYSKLDTAIQITAKSVVAYRLNNESWKTGKKISADYFSEKIVYRHYLMFYFYNRENLSVSFLLRIFFWHFAGEFIILRNNFKIFHYLTVPVFELVKRITNLIKKNDK